jgi:hypothetical protein
MRKKIMSFWAKTPQDHYKKLDVEQGTELEGPGVPLLFYLKLLKNKFRVLVHPSRSVCSEEFIV